MLKRVVVLAGLLLVLGGVALAGYLVTTTRAQAPRYRTAPVDRGSIVAAVSSTGSLNAVTTVQVGSQVSGQIKELYVDFNTAVTKNQLIARIDPETFRARLNAARAEVDSAQAAVLNQQASVEKARAEVENVRAATVTAEANIARMQADIENARAAIATAQANTAREAATLANARRELERRVDLLRRELIAQSEKDQAQTAYDTAVAQVEAARSQERAGQAALRSAEAQLAAARSQARAAQAQLVSAQAALRVAEAQRTAAEATVRQKQAALDQARVDLEHTEIRAPVNGVVVSRSVDVGQTVAASLQAPTLFTIAEDLTRMQVEAAVDEADIGRLRERMPATFTVDAFPGQTFRGEIVQIRKAPQVVQNVVTYTTVIAVANPNRTLMPGMTANVRIQVDRKEGVLRIPNAALRFRLPGDAATPGGGAPAAGGRSADGTGARGRRGDSAAGGAAGAGTGPRREALVRDLGLTAEQQARLDTILGEARAAFGATRGSSADDREREAQRQRIGAETREKIRQMLTPQQRTTYDALAAAQEGAAPTGTPARIHVVGPDGKPQPVPIVVGATDGTYSEVLQGDLRAGQAVIVGQGAAGTRTGGSAPRLRL